MLNLQNLMSLAETNMSEVAKLLSNEQEKEIFDAIVANLLDIHNPLRINNFSYATRELIRIHLESYFENEDEVKEAWWFVESEHTHQGRLTRKAKIIYAVIKNYKKDFLDDFAYDDTIELASKLIEKINMLSKYTHFNTISAQDENNTKAKEVFDILLYFLTEIHKTLNNIKKKIEDSVTNELISISVESYYDPSDLGATHGALEDMDIDSFEVLEFSYPEITLQASGTMYFSLQWGSNSDVRNDKGSTGSTSFPYTCDLVVSLLDGEIIQHSEVNVDYDSENSIIRVND